MLFKQCILYSMLLLSCYTSSPRAASETGYTLEQIVVFSRHGLRAPLPNANNMLARITPDNWPQWSIPSGLLTPRGGVLEAYMGHYFSLWLADEQLIPLGECPSRNQMHITANNLQRTQATANYFSLGAFPSCPPVVYVDTVHKMDPTFDLNISDDSPSAKRQLTDAINQHAGTNGLLGLNQQLNPLFQQMSDILDYQHSISGLQNKRYDFSALPSEVIVEAGKMPGLTGPIRIGTSVADEFILQYLDGAPLHNIAWGRIKDEEQLADLASLKGIYYNLVFGTPKVAHLFSPHLITRLASAFGPNKPKFTLLVGHDANLAALFSVLKLKEYRLPHQLEAFPLGGKVVFQRWRNNRTQEALLKVEYIYQSTEQMRSLAQLDRNNPPLRMTLELEACPIDSQGFCSFADFEALMTTLTPVRMG